jgi:hypothetical protein
LILRQSRLGWNFIMRALRLPVLALAALVAAALPASARLLIAIDKSAQVMTVSEDGARLYSWPVSTGQRGYDTPGGQFTPFRMEKDHFSREWDDAPMPHSIFFTERGHAIHGTEHTRNIGRPASHGCVRLEPENARVLFGLVKQAGIANTSVVLTGETPAGGAPAVARRGPRYDDGGEITASVPARSYPRDERPIYWGPGQPRTRGYVYDDDAPYRRMPQPSPYFFGPRY